MKALITTKTWCTLFIMLGSLTLNLSCTDDDDDPSKHAGTLPGGPETGLVNNPKTGDVEIQVNWDAEAKRIDITSTDVSFVQAEIQRKGQAVRTVALNPNLTEQSINLDANFNGDYVLKLFDTEGEKSYTPLSIN